MNRVFNILLWVVVSLFLLVMALLITTQTTWFREIAKNKALEALNLNIQGTVSVEELDGNFFSNLKLTGVTATSINGDSLLSLQSIKLRYSPIHLLKKVIQINEISIENPIIHLRKENDSTWNFNHFFPAPSIKTEKEDRAPFEFLIRLKSFRMIHGDVHLTMPDSIIPERVNKLNIQLSGEYSSKHARVNLLDFSFESYQPELQVKTISFEFNTDFITHSIKNFYFATNLNQFQLNGQYENIDHFKIDLEWPAIELREFAFTLPDINIPANPDLMFKTESENDTLHLQLTLQDNQESIEIEGSVAQFKNLLTDSLRHRTNLDLNIILNSFQPGNWLESAQLPLLLNANLRITGNGLKSSTIPLRIEGNLFETKWENYLFTKGNFDVIYLDGETTAHIAIVGDFGELSSSAHLNINHPKGPFNASFNSTQLALHQILPDAMDSTIVTLQMNVVGEGIGTDGLTANFDGDIFNSIIEYIPVDTLYLTGKFENSRATLDTLTILNSSMNAEIKGWYALSGDLDINFTGDIFNTNAFSKYFTQPATWDTLHLSTKASGHLDSLSFNTNSNISSLKIDTTVIIQNLHLIAEGQLNHQKPDIKSRISASDIEISGNLIDSIQLDGELAEKDWDATLHTFLPQDMQLHLVSTGSFGEELNVYLHDFTFSSDYSELQLEEAPSQFNLSDSIISLRNFYLSDAKSPDFGIRIDAMFQQGDSLNLNVDIKNFNLETLTNFGISEKYMKGLANLDFVMIGNKERFSITGHSSLDSLEMNPFAISQITTDFNYPGDTAHIRTSIFNSIEDSIYITAATPLVMNLKDSLLISWPQTLKARLRANDIRINEFFLTMPGIDQPKALMTIDLEADGQLQNPEIKGTVDIVNGELPLPQYGIDYKDIRVKLSVDGTEVLLDSVFARHMNGTLLVDGQLTMDSSLFSGHLTSTNINLKAHQFYVARHRDFEVQINADAFFRDVENNPRFGGNIRVLRSSINLPAVMELAEEGSERNEPLLVQSLRETEELVKVTDTTEISVPVQREYSLANQLSGTIKLNFPRNTWIRSDDMQMELYGDLDIIKSSETFELFGNLGIHRGFYTLYGKKLNIREGEFTFTGGEAFDPLINLKADYVFRSNERIRRELTLLVSGRVSDTEIRFELDNQSIPEQDAMAYLLFGQPFDQLSFGNQEGVSNAIPSRLLTGLISNQLGRTIGTTLSLDMIEIDAGDNWQNTTFMVGKYITNNLFVTYQRSFGQVESNVISPETITLEYEITRRLSFRLMQGDVKDSGVDVILKFEK